MPIEVDAAAGSPGAITFGLSAVRNVGRASWTCCSPSATPTARTTRFHDFAERVPEPVLNKRTVESLIKAGAFDNLGHPRRGLLMVFEQIIDTTLVRRRERDQGVMSLFGDLGGDSATGFNERVAIPDNEFDKSDRLRFEKEMLGLYVSRPPAARRRGGAAPQGRLHRSPRLAEREDGARAHRSAG